MKADFDMILECMHVHNLGDKYIAQITDLYNESDSIDIVDLYNSLGFRGTILFYDIFDPDKNDLLFKKSFIENVKDIVDDDRIYLFNDLIEAYEKVINNKKPIEYITIYESRIKSLALSLKVKGDLSDDARNLCFVSDVVSFDHMFTSIFLLTKFYHGEYFDRVEKCFLNIFINSKIYN